MQQTKLDNLIISNSMADLPDPIRTSVGNHIRQVIFHLEKRVRLHGNNIDDQTNALISTRLDQFRQKLEEIGHAGIDVQSAGPTSESA